MIRQFLLRLWSFLRRISKKNNHESIEEYLEIVFRMPTWRPGQHSRHM